jgi:[FeFe] hydrogenase H-cluster maturation GTPase HydF
MELLPIGPVVFIDTAGLDDSGELGLLRIEKTYEVLRKCHFAIVVADVETGITDFEKDFIDQLAQRKIPSVFVLNKCDKGVPSEEEIENLKKSVKIPLSFTSVYDGTGIKALKKKIIDHANYEDVEPALVGDLIDSGDVAVLVTPIDKSAPKGRLILPQQQTIRDIIEKDAVAMITKEHELRHTLESLSQPPAIVITDSQAFLKVSADTPPGIPLTSFSILFARQKTDLAEMVRGIKRIERLVPGDKVLIVEGCTHHRQADDIGKVKIPRWIRQIAGGDIEFHWAAGAHYPKDIEEYAVIVHCGGCMLNRREMQYRTRTARQKGVYITNYGMLIAYVQGILSRALEPFPAAKLALEENDLA